jgi:signal transduction histidine kinase/ActR/RegA family two-component response regulator
VKPEPDKTKPVRILLMEDEAAVARLIQIHLQNHGFVVSVAADGKNGLERAAAQHYDLLIIDHAMPTTSGLDVVRALRQRGPLPPILMISALGRDDVAVEALKLGALDYVVKDATGKFPENLRGAITEVLRKHVEAETMRIASEERAQWLHELGCLYTMEKLFSAEDGSIESVLRAAVNLIPQACRYADLAWARIRVRDLDFRSDGFVDSPLKKAFVLEEMGRLMGRLEVGFREKPPMLENDLFTPDEHKLLHSVADRVGRFIARWYTQQELQRVHEELRRSNGQLRASNAALEEYARVASHDLQEPLRKIESFAQVLVEDYGSRLDAKGHNYLDIMVGAARRMRRLIRDVLALSRAGTAEKPLQEVDLNRVMNIVRDNLSQRIQEKAAEVTVKPLPCLQADETQMVQLFQNLVANGLKFNDKPHPEVEVSSSEDSMNWTFFIKDNGIGIRPAEARTLFAPFKRLQNQQQYEGSGIGLAICRRIVTRHGGTIGVRSEPGQGSTFWVSLPKTQPPQGEPHPAINDREEIP